MFKDLGYFYFERFPKLGPLVSFTTCEDFVLWGKKDIQNLFVNFQKREQTQCHYLTDSFVRGHFIMTSVVREL